MGWPQGSWTPSSSADNTPELSAKHQQICGVLFGALGHFLCSVPQPVEAVVDLFNQLPARGELGLDVGGEVFLPKREAALNGEQFVAFNKHATNLGLGRNPVGHELVARSLVGVTQLRLDVLPGATDTYYAVVSL